MRAFNKKIENVWAALPPAHQLWIPDNSAIDCELCASTDEASDVSHLKVANPSSVVPRIFAIPWWKGKKYVNASENTTLLLKRILTEEYGYLTTAHLHPDDCTLERALAEGIEGYVLKAKNYREWYKLKPKQTVDVFVITALHGYDGKFVNRWGALVCGVMKNGKIYNIANVAKGKDHEWRDLSLSNLVGRVCEITHEGLQAQGKLKFSAFLRWRDDKRMEDCLYDQVEK